MNAEFQEEAKL